MRRVGIAALSATFWTNRIKACISAQTRYARSLAVMVIPGGVTASYYLLENEYERSADLVG